MKIRNKTVGICMIAVLLLIMSAATVMEVNALAATVQEVNGQASELLSVSGELVVTARSWQFLAGGRILDELASGFKIAFVGSIIITVVLYFAHNSIKRASAYHYEIKNSFTLYREEDDFSHKNVITRSIKK